MSELAYQVIKESPGVDLGGYSNMVIVGEYFNPDVALAESFKLNNKSFEGDYYFVKVVRY